MKQYEIFFHFYVNVKSNFLFFIINLLFLTNILNRLNNQFFNIKIIKNVFKNHSQSTKLIELFS